MKIKSLTIICFFTLFNVSCYSQKVAQATQSQFLTDSIYSKNLAEFRKHTIYLPKGFDKKKKYPVIYATDGNSEITDKKNVLDSLIDNKLIKPLIFVASFANTEIADSTSTVLGNGQKVYLSYRNFEYVDRKPTRKEDSLLINRFQNHTSYFTKELIPEIEKRYNQNYGKKNRYFYGVSNGAGFGLSLLNHYPDIIGTYICLSTFGGNIEENDWKNDVDYPDLYLRYGSDEPFFLKNDAEFLNEKYNESKNYIEIKEFTGGHSNKFWEEEFTEIIIRILAENLSNLPD